MSISQIKAQARKDIHEGLSEPAVIVDSDDNEYPTAEQIADGLTFSVRWHNRMKLTGESEQEQAAIIEGIERLILLDEQVAALGIEPQRGWIVRIPAYDKELALDYREERDGPSETKWSVTDA